MILCFSASRWIHMKLFLRCRNCQNESSLLNCLWCTLRPLAPLIKKGFTIKTHQWLNPQQGQSLSKGLQRTAKTVKAFHRFITAEASSDVFQGTARVVNSSLHATVPTRTRIERSLMGTKSGEKVCSFHRQRNSTKT